MGKEILFRIKTLMVLRVLIISLFLGTIIIFQIRLGQLPFVVPVTILIALTYLLTIAYSIHLRFAKKLKLSCYLQLIGDLLVETGVIYISGGIESPFPFLYILSIIAASILYGSLVDLEFYNILKPLTFYSTGVNRSSTGEAVIYTVFLNISAFYLVAFLSSYLSENLRKTGKELEKKSEDLIQLKTFHESVLKNMGSGLMTADLNRRIISFNMAAEMITGYKFYEVRGKPYYDFFNISHSADLSDELIKNPVYREVIFKSKTGQELHLGINISLLRDDKQKIRGIIAVFQDLTKVKEMEKMVVKSERLAAIGRIAAGVAHEIRNPLASISGSIEVLKKELSLNNTNKKLMDIVLRETERLNSIITQFLTYASPHKKNLQRFNIKEIITETLLILKNSKEYPSIINIITVFKSSNVSVMSSFILNLCRFFLCGDA